VSRAGESTKVRDRARSPDPYERPPAPGLAAYAGARGRAYDAIGVYERKAPGPHVVASKVVAIANDPHPKLRNTITKEAKQFTLLRWMLPSGPFEAGVRRAFKLAGTDEKPVRAG
jgi:hypothetical protein